MVEAITVPALRGVPHGFMSRRGGVSHGAVAGLNCGFGAGDDPVAVFGQDQGRHSGGKAYEWGAATLHLKHGLHMRLVNVGAASQVRSTGEMGYPVCMVCGQSRSPMSTLKELDAFNEHHIERCGRPIQKIAFYAEGLLIDGFRMDWALVADEAGPDHLRLCFWQDGAAPPPVAPPWRVEAQGRWTGE